MERGVELGRVLELGAFVDETLKQLGLLLEDAHRIVKDIADRTAAERQPDVLVCAREIGEGLETHCIAGCP